MNQYPKRLIEVDLPIKRISAHARREKNLRSGHISSLHIWWARRPLAACRAVICASLWFDPSDENCPEQFRQVARDEMRKWGSQHRDLMSAESYTRFETANKDVKKYEDNENLRNMLLDFIADFANWDNSTSEPFLGLSQRLTMTAHVNNGGESGTRPLVADPFSGGGAIPLEALRVGADAFASDLNPVAVLLNKVVLEYIPKFGQRLADEVRKAGAWIKEEAEKELADFYPIGPEGSTPIAYLWSRTITCEGPGCGAEVPMIRTNLLFGKGQKRISLEPSIDSVTKSISFSRRTKGYSPFFTAQSGKTICPICSFTTPNKNVMSQMKSRHGGSDDAILIATVLNTTSGRDYQVEQVIHRVHPSIFHALGNLEKNGAFAPSVAVNPNRPSPNARGLSAVTRYGMDTFDSLYNPRQRVALLTIRRLVEKAILLLPQDLRKAVGTCLTLAFGRLVDRNSTLCRWIPQTGAVGYTFGRQALGMIWDYVEINPLKHSGGWSGAIDDIADTLEHNSIHSVEGKAEKFSATDHPLPDDSISAFITDPPYYDAIPYADLSDFFYVWLRPLISSLHSDLAETDTTPKEQEAIWNPGRNLSSGMPKDTKFYEEQIGRALKEGRRITNPNGIGVVVFAHKSTAGWEALLAGMLDAGWIVTASWPVDTERAARTNAIGTASLASSVHLVCRPRETPTGALTTDIGDWRDVLRELPNRIHEWMPRLAEEGVVGADAIFACLGPALEIFSRYSSVEKPSGETVTLSEYLEHVWAAVAKEALNMIFAGADATGYEEDARLTAMWLWTLFSGNSASENPGDGTEEEEDIEDENGSSKKKASGYVLEYDAARKIAQGLGAHLEDLSSIIEVKGDKASLLPVSERARDLFGYESAASGAEATGRKKKSRAQGKLFTEMEEEEYETAFGVSGPPSAASTTLDRVHQTMLLFGAGRSEAVKRFLVDDGIGNDERFWRLADNLSKLYPTGSEEKRWVDGVLARKKGLGF